MSRTLSGKIAAALANITVFSWWLIMGWTIADFIMSGAWYSFVAFLFLANRWVWISTYVRRHAIPIPELDYHFQAPGIKI